MEFFDKVKSWTDEKLSSLDEMMPDLSDYFEFKYLAIFLGILFILVGVCGLYVFREGNAGSAEDKTITVKINAGMNAREIGSLLESKGVIGNSHRFWLLSKLRGAENKFMAGSYRFHKGQTTDAVLAKLVEGEVEEIKFVIPEGFTVKDIAKRLDEEGIADEKIFLKKAEKFCPYEYMEKNEDAYFYAEGFLFPATYKVSSDITEDEILNLMANTFDKRLTKEMRDRAGEMDLSVYELITLASLVEKEAKYKDDQPIIAQVLFKRLKLNMPLQSDATLQYLMDAPKEDVSINDTKIDSPYNTYQNYGLPPGPVANPGIDAIVSVLYPADTDYLYFVADREGHNHYTYSYDEHLDKVDEVR